MRIDVTGTNYSVIRDFNTTVNSLAINSTNAFVLFRFGADLTVTNDLTNEGNLRFRDAATLTAGTFDNNGTLRVEANTNANTTLTITNPFTNDGTILIDNVGASGTGTAALDVSAGLTNSPTGTVESMVGPRGRILFGSVVNNGTVDVEQTLNFTQANGMNPEICSH